MAYEDVELQVLLEYVGGRFVRWRDVFVQVRWGTLTVVALERMLDVFRSASLTRPGKRFAIFVIEPDANVPTAEVRARQKEVLAELGAAGRLFGIVVIEGQGLLAHLGRANMATMSPETLVVGDVGEASRILARERGTDDAEELAKVVTSARRRDRAGPPP